MHCFGWKITDIANVGRHGCPLQWLHNERDGVSNHQPHDCLLNRLFRHRWKKTLKLRVTGLCVWNSPVTGEFPAKRASDAENVSIWWRHHSIVSLKELYIPRTIIFFISFRTIRRIHYWTGTSDLWNNKGTNEWHHLSASLWKEQLTKSRKMQSRTILAFQMVVPYVNWSSVCHHWTYRWLGTNDAMPSVCKRSCILHTLSMTLLGPSVISNHHFTRGHFY